MKQERQQTGKRSPEKDWAERLRDHLAGYEAPVPDDLWEKIEARLPKEMVSQTTPKKNEKKKAKIVALWARWAAVAAVFVGGLVLWNVALDPRSLATEGTQEGGMWRSAEGSLLPEGRKKKNRLEADQTAAVLPLSRGSQRGSEQAHGVAEKETEREAEFEADQTTPPYGHPSYSGGESCAQNKPISSDEKAEKESAEVPSEPEKVHESEKVREAEKRPEEVIRELDQKIAAYKKHRGRRAAINLYASNGFGNQSYRNGVLMSKELLSNYDYYTNPGIIATRAGNSPVYLANHEERQTFYQPISFGLSVNIPISSGFSVSSGVVYTRLRSDFTSIANSLIYERQQTLHYVGIPLTVQYNVWQWRGLNVYAAAGGQADFNVKAQVTTEGAETTLEKDNLQWSVNAAVGVQYNFIPQLGIYAEPGIKYYFDNGSHIRNFFKHRPTNFNLQIGVRMNFGTD